MDLNTLNQDQRNVLAELIFSEGMEIRIAIDDLNDLYVAIDAGEDRDFEGWLEFLPQNIKVRPPKGKPTDILFK